MRSIIAMLVTCAALVAGVHFASAEEDLFDTKAAAAYVEKGVAHLKQKNYDGAIAALEEAVSIAPDAESFYYLGYAYYLKGRAGDGESRKKSIECFDKAYELDPNFTPTKFKPAEAAAEPPKKKTEQQEPSVQPSAPAGPASEQPQETPDAQPQSQTEPPVKATDRVKNIGNVPAVPD